MNFFNTHTHTHTQLVEGTEESQEQKSWNEETKRANQPTNVDAAILLRIAPNVNWLDTEIKTQRLLGWDMAQGAEHQLGKHNQTPVPGAKGQEE
jgi:hypothetical protein